ncbi:MAG TPA: alpha/beta hydrolase [Gemmatimonadaceae bacterium]|nr:alpha/beta hydrolase [Gemmatimonadaceae bacterium]
MTEQDLGFVHRWVPGRGSPLTALVLHGTGGDESDLLPLGAAVAPGAALLSPRGKVRENGAPRFFKRVALGVFDQVDLAERTDELVAFVRRAANVYGFDPTRVVAVGYSNGANIASSAFLRHPGIFARAVLFRPMVPFVPEPPPVLNGMPVYIAAGKVDPIARRENTEELLRVLNASGAAVTVRWEEAGHALTSGEVQGATDWLADLDRPPKRPRRYTSP